MCTSSRSVPYHHKMTPQCVDGCNAKQYGNYSDTPQKMRSQFSELKYIERKIRIKLHFSVLYFTHRGVSIVCHLV